MGLAERAGQRKATRPPISYKQAFGHLALLSFRWEGGQMLPRYITPFLPCLPA